MMTTKELSDVGITRIVMQPVCVFGDLIHKYNLAVESLTEQQLAEVMRQAISSGDLMRLVVIDGRQAVTYIPYREIESLRSLYNELLNAVGRKHYGETRHETALRYIREAELSA